MAGWPLPMRNLANPGTGEITPSTAFGTPRVGHSATLLSDGRVLGRTGADGNTLATVEYWSKFP